jgi:gas vesicle GvpC-like protein
MSKIEIEQMVAQMLTEMPSARQQVATALEHELHERGLRRPAPKPIPPLCARTAGGPDVQSD